MFSLANDKQKRVPTFAVYTVAKKTQAEGIGNVNTFYKTMQGIPMHCHFTDHVKTKCNTL